jgi:hypothetical protein
LIQNAAQSEAVIYAQSLRKLNALQFDMARFYFVGDIYDGILRALTR